MSYSDTAHEKGSDFVHIFHIVLGLGSGYNTMGRPSTLPLGHGGYQRSTSNPDLTTPTTPEAEVAGFFSMYLRLLCHQKCLCGTIFISGLKFSIVILYNK